MSVLPDIVKSLDKNSRVIINPKSSTHKALKALVDGVSEEKQTDDAESLESKQ